MQVSQDDAHRRDRPGLLQGDQHQRQAAHRTGDVQRRARAGRPLFPEAGMLLLLQPDHRSPARPSSSRWSTSSTRLRRPIPRPRARRRSRSPTPSSRRSRTRRGTKQARRPHVSSTSAWRQAAEALIAFHTRRFRGGTVGALRGIRKIARPWPLGASSTTIILANPSPWPFWSGLGRQRCMAIGVVVWMKGGVFGLEKGTAWWLFATGLAGVLFTMLGWWRDVMKEAHARRPHPRRLDRPALRHDAVHRLGGDVLRRVVLDLLRDGAVPRAPAPLSGIEEVRAAWATWPPEPASRPSRPGTCRWSTP